MPSAHSGPQRRCAMMMLIAWAMTLHGLGGTQLADQLGLAQTMEHPASKIEAGSANWAAICWTGSGNKPGACRFSPTVWPSTSSGNAHALWAPEATACGGRRPTVARRSGPGATATSAVRDNNHGRLGQMPQRLFGVFYYQQRSQLAQASGEVGPASWRFAHDAS
jgi:hypothetical protein